MRGARLFFIFYFIATAIQGLHMLVGLYWSFVHIVWLVLYPLIYLVGRGS